jgi:segregation and condensation protein B
VTLLSTSKKTSRNNYTGDFPLLKNKIIMNPEGLTEAILFLSGRKVSKSFLKDVLQNYFGNVELEVVISNLIDRYKKLESGITILEFGDYVQMTSSDKYYEILSRIFQKETNDSELSDALLETLVIIAYKQPIEKSEIERIRGISSGRAISSLIEKGFIKPITNDNIADKISYVTTEKFLEYFNLKSLEELPNIELLKKSLQR